MSAPEDPIYTDGARPLKAEITFCGYMTRNDMLMMHDYWDPSSRTVTVLRDRLSDAQLACDTIANQYGVGTMERRVVYRTDLDGPWHVETSYYPGEQND